ncbi:MULTISPECIES: hypothetical protein [unclassified Mycobacterium]|uniref:hypothetical protein n=1 Tax=unclassified Mycobacterium TaxID=2642494 RepID=UPI000567DEF3|nr:MULTISPECIES: hypothetical protein [unclassified Mycobacterium]
MTDKRRLRSLKQARRDVRRAKKRNAGNALDGPLKGLSAELTDVLRPAMNRHPGYLLSMASCAINVGKRKPAQLDAGTPDDGKLHRMLTNLMAVRDRQVTALLAVIAELLVDDPVLQLECREELAQRHEHLPRWIASLAQVDVHRAVRRTDVFGDVDEIAIGARLVGGHGLTVVVRVDHNRFSSVTDIAIVPEPIDDALARIAAQGSEYDVVEMNLADARAWIENAVKKPLFARDGDRWMSDRPLATWLISRLPEGGVGRSPSMGWASAEQLCESFFVSSSSAPFDGAGYREQLLELFETGTEDPLRWSETRVRDVLRNPSYYDDDTPLEVALDIPDLLRAFIPYAHAQSGIGDELTSRSLAVIDELRSSYRRELMREAHEFWGYDDVG